MNVCPTCERVIGAGVGCNPNHAYVYGTEPWVSDLDGPLLDICRDCGTGRIEPHHVPGCMVATCRICDDQATFCEHPQ
jgi:hypothetical protein